MYYGLIAILFIIYSILSFSWSSYNYYDAFLRLRYILGGFLTFFICEKYLSDWFYVQIINLMSTVQIINLFLVSYQLIILKLHPDFCNGIFGFTQYNNAMQGIFCLAISLLAVIYFVDGRWKWKRSVLQIALSCIICALAEIKIFFVMFVIGVFLIFLLRKKNRRQKIRVTIIILGIVGLLIVAYQVLKIVMPENLRVFQSLEGALFYEDRTTYAGRTNTIPFVYHNVFENDWMFALFGTGIGTNAGQYIYELGKSFADLGFIGLGLLMAFLGCVFLSGIYQKKEYIETEQFSTAIFSIMIVIGVIVWNCLFTRCTYLVFFFLSIRNVKGFRDNEYRKDE